VRLTPWKILVPTVLASVAVALVVLNQVAPAAPASCGAADDDRREGLLVPAEKGYRAILDDEPTSECAKEGLRKLFMRRCRWAGRLRSDDATRAEELYGELLDTRPAFENVRTCALSGLAEIGKDAPPTKPRRKRPRCVCGFPCQPRHPCGPPPNDPQPWPG
jgi:hypothetical protein